MEGFFEDVSQAFLDEALAFGFAISRRGRSDFETFATECLQNAFRGEIAISFGDGIRIDGDLCCELADRGDSVAGGEEFGGDGKLNLSNDLFEEGDAVVRVELEEHKRGSHVVF